MKYLNYPFDDYVSCALCKADDFTSVSYPERYGTSARLVICNQCGLGFLNPRWSHENYSKFYGRDYRALTTSGTLQELARRQLIHGGRVLELCSNFVNRKSKVLDIGCSTGTLLYVFKRYWNCNVFGIEPSIEEAAFAQNEYRIPVFTGLMEEFYSQNSKHWDLIVSTQTFNHLLDPFSDLQKMWNMLRSDGKIFLEVQNFPEFARLRNRPIKVDHTYYFWTETLLCMLARVGFVPICMSVDTKESYLEKHPYIVGSTPCIHIHILAEKSESIPHYPLPDGKSIARELQVILEEHTRRKKAIFPRSLALSKRLARGLLGAQLYNAVKHMMLGNSPRQSRAL